MATWQIVIDDRVQAQTFEGETDDAANVAAANMRTNLRQKIVVRKVDSDSHAPPPRKTAVSS